jgi:catechol 2,3-dioxygenase-like lactoylglutathione lyase family enzyme
MSATRLLLVLSLSAVAFAQSPATPVVSLGNLAHTTETLDKTVPFYRDVLGLTTTWNPQSPPQKLNEEMSKFTATQGASFRAATFRIPNANFGFELTEFTGAPRKSGVPQISDIGAATLALQVRDLNAVLAKVKAAGATIVTQGGMPVNNEIVVRDPDGFLIELVQPARIPAAATGDILGASVHLAVGNAEETAVFLKNAIGFTAPPRGAMTTNADVLKLIGLPAGATFRITHGSIPGMAADFALIEYGGLPRAKFALGANDPGSPAFTMVVSDINAAVDQWTKAGGTVASTGGKAIVQASGAGNVFVRDVNGFMWELIQRAR